MKNNKIKIGDFGDSKVVRKSYMERTGLHGTNLYMSPELYLLNYAPEYFLMQRVTTKSDIW